MNEESAFGWLLRSLKPDRNLVMASLLFGVFISLAAFTIPLLTQQIIDAAVAGTVKWNLIGLLVLASIINVLPVTFVIRQYLSSRYRYRLRGELYSHLMSLDLGYHNKHGSTEVITKAGKGVGAATQMVIYMSDGQVIIAIPIAILAAGFIAYLSWTLNLSILVFILLFMFVGRFLGGRLSKAQAEYESMDTKITARHQESIFHVSAVKLHQAEKIEEERYWTKGAKALAIQLHLARVHGVYQLFSRSSTTLGTVLAVLIIIPQVRDGTMSPGNFVALMLYAGQVLAPAAFLGALYSEILEELARMKPMMEILKEKPRVVEAEDATDVFGINHSIRIDNVSYTYDQNGVNPPVLKGINLTIPAGKTTAFVGKTGSGKSTLIKLLARFDDPQQGRILYDNVDLRQISDNSLRSSQSLLQQDIPIFSGNIFDNVAFGIENADATDVDAALRKAAADFVFDPSQGFRGLLTKVGENGKQLSGGQKQRIALARIFMRDPQIIMLDEATAALDNETERMVQQSFIELARKDSGRTMIVIAHRLSTVRDADQIVVFDKGTIAAVGTHEELLASCSIYQALNKTELN